MRSVLNVFCRLSLLMDIFGAFPWQFFPHTWLLKVMLCSICRPLPVNLGEAGDSGKRWLILESHSTTVCFTIIGIWWPGNATQQSTVFLHPEHSKTLTKYRTSEGPLQIETPQLEKVIFVRVYIFFFWFFRKILRLTHSTKLEWTLSLKSGLFQVTVMHNSFFLCCHTSLYLGGWEPIDSTRL